MTRDPLSLVKTRVGLGAERIAAQVAAAIGLFFAVVFAIPGAVLWFLETDSARVALFAVAGSFLLVALIAWVAIAVIGIRQERLRRQGSLPSALIAHFATRPATVVGGGSRLFRLIRRSPLLSLGGAIVAGLVITSLGSRGGNTEA